LGGIEKPGCRQVKEVGKSRQAGGGEHLSIWEPFHPDSCDQDNT